MSNSISTVDIYFTSIEKEFFQLILISLDSASLEHHQYSRQTHGPMKMPKLTPTPRNQTLDLITVETNNISLMNTGTTKSYLKYTNVNERNLNHGGKRRKCWLTAFPSLVPTMLSKTFFPRAMTTEDCLVKVYPFSNNSQIKWPK